MGSLRCRGWRAAITRAADGELSERDKENLRRHLDGCPGCADATRELTVFRDRWASGAEVSSRPGEIETILARSRLAARPRRDGPGRALAWLRWSDAVTAGAVVVTIVSLHLLNTRRHPDARLAHRRSIAIVWAGETARGESKEETRQVIERTLPRPF